MYNKQSMQSLLAVCIKKQFVLFALQIYALVNRLTENKEISNGNFAT